MVKTVLKIHNLICNPHSTRSTAALRQHRISTFNIHIEFMRCFMIMHRIVQLHLNETQKLRHHFSGKLRTNWN